MELKVGNFSNDLTTFTSTLLIHNGIERLVQADRIYHNTMQS